MTWTPDEIPDLTGKVALVTGANSGIGYWTALHLARHGARVVMACRSPERATEALGDLRTAVPTGEFEILPLDLADLASVRAAAAEYRDRHTRLDVLCNNAGVAMVSKQVTKDGFELHLGANFLGHFALTALLADLVTGTPSSRVIHIGSLQHRLGRFAFTDPHYERRRYTPWGAYGQSKVGTLLFMAELERRFRRSGTDAISLGCHPGAAGTGIIEEMPVIGSPRLRRAAEVIGGLFPTPEEAAYPTLFTATAPGLAGGSYYGPGGRFEISGTPAPARISRRALREADALRVWNLAEQMTGTRFVDLR